MLVCKKCKMTVHDGGERMHPRFWHKSIKGENCTDSLNEDGVEKYSTPLDAEGGSRVTLSIIFKERFRENVEEFLSSEKFDAFKEKLGDLLKQEVEENCGIQVRVD